MRCSFCGNDVTEGTGVMFVRKTGKILYFCSRKCDKNFLKLGREPRHVTWTQEYRRLKGKVSAAAAQEELAKEAAETAAGPTKKVAVSAAAAKKLKGA